MITFQRRSAVDLREGCKTVNNWENGSLRVLLVLVLSYVVVKKRGGQGRMREGEMCPWTTQGNQSLGKSDEVMTQKENIVKTER